MTRSLRRRAILSGIGLSVLSILIGALVLVTRVDDIALRRFDAELAERHLQLVVALVNGGLEAGAIAAELTDPLYDRPYSGHYWQVMRSDGTILTSRSLFDALLTVPDAAPDLRFAGGLGPDGELRLVWRQVTLEDGTGLTVAVAHSMAQLYNERWEIRQSLLSGFAVVGLLGLIIAILQTTAVLRPLTALRQDITQRWDSAETLNPADYPEEVAPLVQDINILLDRNRDIIERTRRQGADLAHALKTPSAILRNELARLESAGQQVDVAKDALERIDAQIKRSLARVRAANLGAAVQVGANLRTSAERLARVFATLPDTRTRSLRLDVPSDLRVSMDAQDLEEVLGNLIENGMKFSRSTLVLSAHRTSDSTVITVEDDGPGIPEPDRIEALRPGGRLDTATNGTGLGLAIASDVVKAYGGTLTLGSSDQLGGLLARIDLPVRYGL
ncbi:MAG: HAMP domain-containing sensor histidine kinase [Pseudomonadota bacterium]